MSRNGWIGLVAAILGAVIIAIAVWIVVFPPGQKPQPSPATASATPSTTPRPTSTIRPTTTATPTPTSTPTQGATTVTPLITFDSFDSASRTLTVGANVQGTVAQAGTCTLSATGPGGTVSGTFAARFTGSGMDCGSMTLQSSSFTSGTWVLRVDYASAGTAGTTSGYEVYIP